MAILTKRNIRVFFKIVCAISFPFLFVYLIDVVLNIAINNFIAIIMWIILIAVPIWLLIEPFKLVYSWYKLLPDK